MKYRSEIDGLRSIAVIPVVMFHAGFNAFSGGYVGVDIFFVISGYLITTILLNDLQAENFSIVRFYERRARRILPALFFVMLITIPFGWILLSPDELISFSKSVSAVSLFISNFFFWRDGGYFETAAELKPLLHTWSLAVEEQYYIFFPVFLLLFWRFGKRFIFKGLILAAIISLVIAQAGATLKPVPNFFLLPSRVWEIAIGAIAALCLINKYFSGVGLKSKQIFSFLGLVFILLAIFLFNSETPTPSIYTLLPTIGAALIILFAEQATYVGRLLSARVFVGIGVISYSAYLWHQPILAFSRIYDFSIGFSSKIAILALIFILSIFSWKYIESPFREKNLFSRKFIFTSSIAVSVLFLLFGYWSSKSIAKLDRESTMAKVLANSAVIYSSNMNERNFIKSRIEVETISPKIVVLGSSRIMQIGSHNTGKELLNLGVSGSSVEDDIAIWKLASVKFDPDTVLIGADPWLFNSKSGQDRWKSLEAEYYSSLSDLSIDIEKPSTTVERKKGVTSDVLVDLYKAINISKITAANDSPELIDKIRRDGSRVYNLSYENQTKKQVESGATSYASYAMMPYENSIATEKIFEKFIRGVNKNHRVILLLSPYHPKLYSFMKSEDKKFIDIEKRFKNLSDKLEIEIIGSYDPEKVGCDSSEFYGGMHPKDSCMDKVIKQIK